MHSSRTSTVISNVFGTLGAVCWSIQLIPQIVLNYRRHAASGLSSNFMLLWACAGIPLGVYNIVQNFNVALRIQPQILTTLSLCTWGQCQYYQRGWGRCKVFSVALLIAACMGGMETALIFATRIGLASGINWPLTLMAVLAAVFLALGVIEQYVAIWKTKSIEGISFLFCGIDALGDVTSIISVCFEPHLQVLGLVMYAVELLLWLGVFACGAYYSLIPWFRNIASRRKARLEMEPTHFELTALPITSSSTSVFRTPSEEMRVRSRRLDTIQI